jgi:hypothetical protein
MNTHQHTYTYIYIHIYIQVSSACVDKFRAALALVDAEFSRDKLAVQRHRESQEQNREPFSGGHHREESDQDSSQIKEYSHSHKEGSGHSHKEGSGHSHKEGSGHSHKEGSGHSHKEGSGHSHKEGSHNNIQLHLETLHAARAEAESKLTALGKDVSDQPIHVCMHYICIYIYIYIM